jgi:hypothetical protein
LRGFSERIDLEDKLREKLADFLAVRGNSRHVQVLNRISRILNKSRTQENPSKQLQIPPENPALSNSRNGRKITAVNYRYGWKIPASKNRYGRKILRPVTKKRPESLIINATETSA